MFIIFIAAAADSDSVIITSTLDWAGLHQELHRSGLFVDELVLPYFPVSWEEAKRDFVLKEA